MSEKEKNHLLPDEIISYLNDDHTSERKDQLLHHLDGCPECFTLFNKLSAISDKWRAIEENGEMSSDEEFDFITELGLLDDLGDSRPIDVKNKGDLNNDLPPIKPGGNTISVNYFNGNII